MKLKPHLLTLIPVTVSFIFLALPVFTQAVEIPNPLKADTFEELVEAIIGFIFNIALVVAPIMIIIAGFIFVTGGGEPKSIQNAKNILIYTVIGLFIIMISRGLIEVIKQFFRT